MAKLTKAEFMDKLARMPEDKATAEENAIFDNADKERAAGTYGGMGLEEFIKTALLLNLNSLQHIALY